MPKRKRKLTNKERALTKQYLVSLQNSMDRCDRPDFNHLVIKIKDRRLAKLLLAVCHNQKRYLPEYAELLLTQQLHKNYRDYFENEDLDVRVETYKALSFFKKPRMCTQDERLYPAGSTYDNGF